MHQPQIDNLLTFAQEKQQTYVASAVGSNGHVLAQADCTGFLEHAETNLINALKNTDLPQEGFTIYTSGEPCPMCMGAIMWWALELRSTGRLAENSKVQVVFLLGRNYLATHANSRFQRVKAESILRKSDATEFVTLIGPFCEKDPRWKKLINDTKAQNQ